MSDDLPSPPDDNGRDANGRFTAGNNCGTGNPHNRQVQQLRSALIGAITEQDIGEIAAMLIEKAKAGDVLAAREVLDRALGKPKQTIEMDQSDEVREIRVIEVRPPEYGNLPVPPSLPAMSAENCNDRVPDGGRSAVPVAPHSANARRRLQ